MRAGRLCRAGDPILIPEADQLGLWAGLGCPAPSRPPAPSGGPGGLQLGRRPAEGAAGRCHRVAEGACLAAGRQRPGQLCGVLRPQLAAFPGAATAAASPAPGRGARGRAARAGRSERAPWPRRAARSRLAKPRPPARHGRLPRARRRPGLGPDGAAGRQPRGPEQRLRVGLRLVQRLRARRRSRAGQGAPASQQAAFPRTASLRAQVSAAAAAGGISRPPGTDTERGVPGHRRSGLSWRWLCVGVIPQHPGTGTEWGSFPGTGSLARLLCGTEAGAASNSPAGRQNYLNPWHQQVGPP